ncbi:hypothetical protein LI064_16360 [Clostridium perfringens]|uniref:hypothetical protein n=1 Tax=Clostridium perfringens TaxID=1502 RepID=UPI002247EC4D|nr:hypothetical protein [Clostridium perfringens]MCX0356084.1 hypothetical protein [Clostridium perfringens]MDM0612801.1 hypothetical protein [Clostridium perfringens]
MKKIIISGAITLGVLVICGYSVFAITTTQNNNASIQTQQQYCSLGHQNCNLNHSNSTNNTQYCNLGHENCNLNHNNNYNNSYNGQHHNNGNGCHNTW